MNRVRPYRIVPVLMWSILNLAFTVDDLIGQSTAALAQASEPHSPDDSENAEKDSADAAARLFADELDSITREYARQTADIQSEAAAKIAAAQAKCDQQKKELTQRYIASLERVRDREEIAGNRDAVEAIQRNLDRLASGPLLNDVQILWAESFSAEANGDHLAAISAVDKVIQKTGLAEATFVKLRLGWLNYLAGDYPESEAAYRAAAANAPDAITPLQGLLNCSLAQKHSAEAKNIARKILTKDPMNFGANKTLGELFYADRQYDISAGFYRRLAEAYPDNMDIATRLAWCYLGLDESATAKQIFVNVLAIQPENASAIAGYVAANQRAELANSDSQSPQVLKSRIVLINAGTSVDAVQYVLNEKYPVTLGPGEVQFLENDRTWMIRLTSKSSESELGQKLEPGRYEFTFEKEAWNLTRQPSSR